MCKILCVVEVLGKLSMPGCPTYLDSSRQGPNALAVGAGGGCLDIFSLLFSFLPPPLPPPPTVWIRVGQGPTALAVGAGGGCLDIFTLICPLSSLSPSLWETTRYRLKYCLKGSLSSKTTNQPTNPPPPTPGRRPDID